MRSRIHAVVIPSEVRRLRRGNPPRLPRARPDVRRRRRSPANARRRSTSSKPTRPWRWSSTCRASIAPRSASCQGRRGADRRVKKPARRGRSESSFHLVERGFGRFARVVRLGRACDAARARADVRARRAADLHPEDRGSPRPRDSDFDHLVRDPLHRRHRRAAGPRAGAARAGGARRGARDRSRDRQRRELRRRLRHHARDRRPAARVGRRRHDVGQSHLGQEGSARLHRHRAAPAAAGQLPRRRAGQRQLPRADEGRCVGRRRQRHGPRVHGAARRSVRGRAARDRGAARRGRASSSSTFTPRRRPRRSRWAGISTAR